MTGPLNWKRYGAIYVLAMLGLMVFGLLINRLFGISMPSGLSTVLPPMLAAMIEGQKRANEGLAPFSGTEAWSAASLATFVVGVITVFVLAGALMLGPVRMAFQSISSVTLLLVFAGLMAVTLVINRIFLPLGYKNQQKALDKKRAGE